MIHPASVTDCQKLRAGSERSRCFRATHTGSNIKPLTPDSIYIDILKYGQETGISMEVDGLSPDLMRRIGATKALA